MLNLKINRSRRRLRWDRIFLILFGAGLLVATVFFLFRSRGDVVAVDINESSTLSSYSDYFEKKKEWISNHVKIELSITGGKSFYELLTEYYISAQDIIRINKAIKPLYDLSKIKEGQRIDVWLNRKEEKVDKLSFELSPDKVLHVTRNGPEFLPSIVALSNISVPTLIGGKIQNSFYESGIEGGMPPEIIMDIADVFAWDIDFLVDIRPGDSFKVIFEQRYRKGKYIGHGKVLAARFVNQHKVFNSFYFTDSSGRSSYYDKNGKSLRKAFLKSPLRYRRISSYFSKKRFHPILKIYRPHYGVDYAAPIGTPVESIGDGRITFIGWKGGYGRYIKIRHNHIYETAYGHLSRFGRGLKKGSKVKQGDVIGFVGSSGLSTGPHLDFSVTKRGRYIDPLKIKSPPALRLSTNDKERFNAVITRMVRLWQEDQSS